MKRLKSLFVFLGLLINCNCFCQTEYFYFNLVDDHSLDISFEASPSAFVGTWHLYYDSYCNNDYPELINRYERTDGNTTLQLNPNKTGNKLIINSRDPNYSKNTHYYFTWKKEHQWLSLTYDYRKSEVKYISKKDSLSEREKYNLKVLEDRDQQFERNYGIKTDDNRKSYRVVRIDEDYLILEISGLVSLFSKSRFVYVSDKRLAEIKKPKIERKMLESTSKLSTQV